MANLALLNFSNLAHAEDNEGVGEKDFTLSRTLLPADASQPDPHHRFLGHATLTGSADFDKITSAEHPQLTGLQSPSHAEITNGRTRAAQCEDPDFIALRDYVRQIEQPNSNGTSQFKVAEADNALDALREFLRDKTPPTSAPTTPDPVTPVPKAKRSAPASTPHPSVGAGIRPLLTFGDGHNLGTTTCLTCHATHADTFDKTLMGRIGKSQPGKFDCENCHGPASNHVKAGGCAACHGENVSRRPGMPTLAGQHPEYLIPIMKAYIAGSRKHDLMRTILSGTAENDLKSIALYYSHQAPAQAQTPLPGDPVAGKAASALCAGCHGEKGTSVYPAWPNLAGQDAQYLSSAIRAYRDGARNKAVACAGCHGEGGVSKREGIPSLSGQDPQYLVQVMKEYLTGERKHDLMKAMLSGVSETELKKIALYYARQTPAQTKTPLIGDPAAGKKISETCAGCHGEQGVSPSPEFPSLAGQNAQYLATVLKAYKVGTYNNQIMHGVAEALDERAMNDVASYYASLQPAKPDLSDSDKSAPLSEPVLVRNNLVASLDERKINDIASYFASLQPTPSDAANAVKSTPALPMPGLVMKAALSGGRSLGGIISFRKNDPGRKVEDNNAICLGCHERGGRTYWSGSTHETRNVACTECHTVMKQVSRKANLKTENEPETCFQCHKDRRAQSFRSSHMPLREGKIVCSSCHNPHGSATEALLIESSINNNCYKCHAEKRGPFLFEHTPVRENCLNCHDPHGAVNEYLLKISRPRLCNECHTIDHGKTIAGGPRVVQGFGRSCQNCHSKVHGTNSPSGALLLR